MLCEFAAYLLGDFSICILAATANILCLREGNVISHCRVMLTLAAVNKLALVLTAKLSLKSAAKAKFTNDTLLFSSSSQSPSCDYVSSSIPVALPCHQHLIIIVV